MANLKPWTIVFVVTRMDEMGGVQVHMRDLSRRLQALGHRPVVVAGTDGKILNDIRAMGIECHVISTMTRSIGLGREIQSIIVLTRLLKKIRPDLVSCHSSKAGVIGRLSALIARVPAIFTVHGWAFTDNVPWLKRQFYWACEWIMARTGRHIITVSDYDRQLGLRSWITGSNHITTIHNGMVDVPHIPIAAADHQVRLLMVARFAPQKDQASLVRALARLADLPWQLRLVGNGDSSAIISLIQNLGLGDRIHIMGERHDVDQLLDRTDLFCLTTHWEGFPRSILEAMRAGLPVIATGVAGVPESVVHGVTGLVIPYGDQTALVDGLRTLITNPVLRQIMGRAARHRYEQEFTFDQMVNKTLALYTQVIPVDKVIVNPLA